ncbi:MAG: glycosyltransferase family 2 protein [Crocinitomicaceae bacterium]|nr:glycosyltransferase family 2 protein [Crocinitomicaceae bacterium]
MIQLSAVIITFNEERNIERCLKSLEGVADEIVVVDSFSKDSTKQICSGYPVKFVEHAFEGHIQQKNWAITQAENPYVLSLDADEALDETLKKSILEVKKNFTADGYTMNRLTNYCGKWVHHCGWYPDTKLRLWDSRKGKWGGTNPHDKYEMTEKNAVIKHLSGDILHYSYYTIEDHYKQIKYFTDILAKAQYQDGKKAPLFVVYLSPAVKFFKDYFIKLGILDGKTGFRICRLSAWATFQKYQKLRNLIRSNGLSLEK